MDTFLTHEIRITSHGKIQAWVEFALNHLETKPDHALILHTLPAPLPRTEGPSNMQNTPTGNEKPPAQNSGGKERMSPSVSSVPRLISVVEIIKREYLKKLDAANQDDGRLTGLYQYNEIGSLPEPETERGAATGGADQEEARINALTAALRGKNHLKLKKTPYMKVIVSRKELDSVHTRGFTAQKPAIRTLPRSAKMRAKRRLKKQSVEHQKEEGMVSATS